MRGQSHAGMHGWHAHKGWGDGGVWGGGGENEVVEGHCVMLEARRNIKHKTIRRGGQASRDTDRPTGPTGTPLPQTPSTHKHTHTGLHSSHMHSIPLGQGTTRSFNTAKEREGIQRKSGAKERRKKKGASSHTYRLSPRPLNGVHDGWDVQVGGRGRGWTHAVRLYAGGGGSRGAGHTCMRRGASHVSSTAAGNPQLSVAT